APALSRAQSVMRHRLFTVIACVGTASVGCANWRARARTTGATWTCAAPSSPLVQRMRTWVAVYVWPQSTAADSYRAQLQLPRMRAESLAVVTAPAICDRAGLAYARAYE